MVGNSTIADIYDTRQRIFRLGTKVSLRYVKDIKRGCCRDRIACLYMAMAAGHRIDNYTNEYPCEYANTVVNIKVYDNVFK